MPRKAQPYGGLPRYHVRRIQAYLEHLRALGSALPQGDARRWANRAMAVRCAFSRGSLPGVAAPWRELVGDPILPHHAVASRAFLDAYFIWMAVVSGSSKEADERAALAGFDEYTVPALKAGIIALKRKRKGRLGDLDPHQSFAGIGIVAEWPKP